MEEFGKKAKDGILSGFQFIKGKVNVTIDLQKLYSQQKTLQHRRDECLLEVGQRVFVFFEMDRVQNLKEDDWESIRPRVDEVKDINRKLVELEEQIAQVKAGHPEESHGPEHSEDAPPT